MKGTIYRGNGDNMDFIDISESNLSVRSNTDGEKRRKKRKLDIEWGEVRYAFLTLGRYQSALIRSRKKHEPPVNIGFHHF